MHGAEARVRCRALLTAAMRRIAADPQGRATVDHGDIFEGVRSFHISHSRGESREAAVGEPVYVIFYRVRDPGLIEIVRVLHERMEPGRHVNEGT
jgi:toxin ParE1/3/4